MDQFLRFLYGVARGMTKKDLAAMKFLITGESGVNRQQLDGASANEVLILLKDRNMISGSDVSFLNELLRLIRRPDLCAKDHISPDTRHRLPATKRLMLRIAQSMKNEDKQNVCFCLGIDNEDYDNIELMKLIEDRQPVWSHEELRRVASELQLSHRFDEALRIEAATGGDMFKDKDLKSPPVVSTRKSEGVVRRSSVKPTNVAITRRLTPFCDATGCHEGCLYRSLWSEKFPRQSTPVFSSERLLNHEDLTIDGENTAEQLLLGEGAFGQVYKGALQV